MRKCKIRHPLEHGYCSAKHVDIIIGTYFIQEYKDFNPKYLFFPISHYFFFVI